MGKVIKSGKTIIKILGVIKEDDLSPEKHTNNIFKDAQELLRKTKTTLRYMDKTMMRIIINTMIKPQVEHTDVVCSFIRKST